MAKGNRTGDHNKGKHTQYPKKRKPLENTVWKKVIKPRWEEIRGCIARGTSETLVATKLGISINYWGRLKQLHPDFADMVVTARIELIADLRNKLYDLAMGNVEDKTTTSTAIPDPSAGYDANGNPRAMIKQVTTTSRYLPPNPSAIYGLLNLVDPEYVRDKAQYELTKEIAGISDRPKAIKAGGKALQKAAQEAKNLGVRDIMGIGLSVANGHYRSLGDASIKIKALQAIAQTMTQNGTPDSAPAKVEIVAGNPPATELERLAELDRQVKADMATADAKAKEGTKGDGSDGRASDGAVARPAEPKSGIRKV